MHVRFDPEVDLAQNANFADVVRYSKNNSAGVTIVLTDRLSPVQSAVFALSSG